MAIAKKIKPTGGIKVVVLDSAGNPKVLGTIAVWEHATPAQNWVKENSGSEVTAQLIYVDATQDFSMESDLALKVNKKKTINSKFTVKIREV